MHSPSQSKMLPSGYGQFLADLKSRIQSAQIKAVLSVNRELILLYWDIGKRILDRQKNQGWGMQVIEKLALDIQQAFPGIEGFSTRNIWRMRAFYLAYAEYTQKLPQAVADIPWGHNVLLMEKIKNSNERLWYAQKTIAHGWSRAVLWHHIDTKLHQRQVTNKTTNFSRTLPTPQSDLANEIIKDPYNFDFLTLTENAHEKHFECGLLSHIRKFLLELGVGFYSLAANIL